MLCNCYYRRKKYFLMQWNAIRVRNKIFLVCAFWFLLWCFSIFFLSSTWGSNGAFWITAAIHPSIYSANDHIIQRGVISFSFLSLSLPSTLSICLCLTDSPSLDSSSSLVGISSSFLLPFRFFRSSSSLQKTKHLSSPCEWARHGKRGVVEEKAVMAVKVSRREIK